MKTIITLCSLLMMGLVATSCSSKQRTEERVVVTDSETVEKREVKKTTQNTDADYDATSSGRAR